MAQTLSRPSATLPYEGRDLGDQCDEWPLMRHMATRVLPSPRRRGAGGEVRAGRPLPAFGHPPKRLTGCQEAHISRVSLLGEHELLGRRADYPFAVA